MDSFEAFKNMQKQSWANFAPVEMFTMRPAANLVKFAGVTTGQQVLDVGCGTGVVAVTAARLGAKSHGPRPDARTSTSARARIRRSRKCKLTGMRATRRDCRSLMANSMSS